MPSNQALYIASVERVDDTDWDIVNLVVPIRARTDEEARRKLKCKIKCLRRSAKLIREKFEYTPENLFRVIREVPVEVSTSRRKRR